MKIALLSNYPIAPFLEDKGAAWPNEHPYPWVKNLAEALVHIGIQVNVVALRRDIAKPKVYHRAGVQYHFVPFPYKILRGLFPLAAPTQTLCNYLRVLNPDIVHAQGAGMYSHAALKSGLPTVVTMHGIVSDYPSHLARANRREILLEREVVSLSKHIISINPYVTQWLEKNSFRGQIHCIENAIDPVFFEVTQKVKTESNMSNILEVLFVGGLTPRKRVEDAINVTARFANARLSIVSQLSASSRYKEKVQRLIESLGMVDRVRWFGYLQPDQLLLLMQQAFCLLLTAEAETAPMVVAEAMAAGLPVIATKVGGLPFMVEDGRTGFLIDVGDIDMLQEKIAYMVNNASICATIIANAKSKARSQWPSNLIAQKTMQIYSAILAK